MVSRGTQGNVKKVSVGAKEKRDMLPLSFQASFEPGPQGGGTVELRYWGPLAKHRPLWARLGERRSGKQWVAPRDVAMNVSHGQATAVIECGPGAPLEGVCVAFYAHKDGATSEERAWDNAGHDLGYYDLDLESGAVTAR